MIKNNQSPAFQFYPKDFISSADVQTMTAEEIGCYFLLLCYSWLQEKQCFLPKDEKFLRTLCKITRHKWKKIYKVVMKKFNTTEDGKEIYNMRLLSEYHKQVTRKKTLIEAGKKGAENRWGRHEKPDGVAIVSPMAKDSSSSSSSSSTASSSSSPKEEQQQEVIDIRRLFQETIRNNQSSFVMESFEFLLKEYPEDEVRFALNQCQKHCVNNMAYLEGVLKKGVNSEKQKKETVAERGDKLDRMYKESKERDKK